MPTQPAATFAANPATLEAQVRAIAKDEGRAPGTPGHDEARRYLVGRLGEIGLAPYRGDAFELPFSARGLELANVVGVVPGRDAGREPVLLGAHYDTCGQQPGADDNAAAIAAVIAAAVVLDLVGHQVEVPGLEDLLLVLGVESCRSHVSTLRRTAVPSSLRIVATRNAYAQQDMSDHHVFRVEGRPYLFLTCGTWRHYHAHSDRPEVLDYGKLAGVTEYLAGLVRGLDEAELSEGGDFDTTAYELECMRATLAPVLAAFGIGGELRDRGDIDRLAALLRTKLTP